MWHYINFVEIDLVCALERRGFFHGYSFITVCMVFNHALRYLCCSISYKFKDTCVCMRRSALFWFSFITCSGIAVSMVMKYADNIVKVRLILLNIYILVPSSVSWKRFLGLAMIQAFSEYIASVKMWSIALLLVTCQTLTLRSSPLPIFPLKELLFPKNIIIH